ncbi:hypothetical protein [Streptomyces sp. GESEQ-35]|uniref:hypothetical protein n=1 Tax=Streptomyces sp. GESEQ-35 TaxID=2812657 RepID=UPI001B324928|nr:hypothetical protein [Streptomyces sp. GESEQ-35]
MRAQGNRGSTEPRTVRDRPDDLPAALDRAPSAGDDAAPHPLHLRVTAGEGALHDSRDR